MENNENADVVCDEVSNDQVADNAGSSVVHVAANGLVITDWELAVMRAAE